MKLKSALLAATFALSTLPLSTHAKTIKVACVGDSITFGAKIKNPTSNSYPAQLQHLLGDGYQIKNFGVSGCTMLNKGRRPWTKRPAYAKATDYQPDIVVIKLGTNDSKPANWEFKDEFLPDTLKLVEHFKSLSSHPRVMLCTPLPGLRAEPRNKGDISGDTIKKIAPLIRQAAEEANVELIDLNTEFTFFGNELPAIRKP